MRRFTRPSAGAAREPDPLLCRFLRTRTWLSPDAFGEGDPGRSPSTAQYWCLKTMRSSGPDGDLAIPEECTDERICFEPAVARTSDS